MNVIMFIYSVCSAIICGLLADNKNRNIILALICGFLFGVISIAYYLIVDKKKENDCY